MGTRSKGGYCDGLGHRAGGRPRLFPRAPLPRPPRFDGKPRPRAHRRGYGGLRPTPAG